MRQSIVCAVAAAFARIILFAAPLAAAPIHVRALPIPNVDPQLVNSTGTLVGYDGDNNLIAVQATGANKRTLLTDVRYDIDLLQLSEAGEVIYSSQDDNNVQTVRGISTGKKHTIRQILQRTNDYSPILVNHE